MGFSFIHERESKYPLAVFKSSFLVKGLRVLYANSLDNRICETCYKVSKYL